MNLKYDSSSLFASIFSFFSSFSLFSIFLTSSILCFLLLVPSTLAEGFAVAPSTIHFSSTTNKIQERQLTLYNPNPRDVLFSTNLTSTHFDLPKKGTLLAFEQKNIPIRYKSGEEKSRIPLRITFESEHSSFTGGLVVSLLLSEEHTKNNKQANSKSRSSDVKEEKTVSEESKGKGVSSSELPFQLLPFLGVAMLTVLYLITTREGNKQKQQRKH